MAASGRSALFGTLDRLFRHGTAVGLTDGQLLDRFASRHDEAAEAAFAALVGRHGPMVLRVCRRTLADPNDAHDAFQATFLVLMRKAATVRRRDTVGPWLYGVARRVAARSRAAAARRREVETQAVRPQAEAPGFDGPGAELWDEVDRLPESQRSAVVLCYLEGLTHEQAAARLGWPVGTVRSRLARARDRLRGRLERRGLGPVAGLVPALRGLGATPAVLPSELTSRTARAALCLAARDAAEAGLVSARAASLAEGVLATMLLTRLKTLASAALAAGALFTAAAGSVATDEAKPAPKPESSAAQAVDVAKVEEAPPRSAAVARSADPADRINQLVTRARKFQEAGDPEAAVGLLREVSDLSEQWRASLGDETTRARTLGRLGAPARVRRRSADLTVTEAAPAAVVVSPAVAPPDVPVPPDAPAPPRPPAPPAAAAPASPPVEPSFRGAGSRYRSLTPSEPAALAERPAEVGGGDRRKSDTERRLDMMEQKLDRVLRTLEGAAGPARAQSEGVSRPVPARRALPALPALPPKPPAPPQPPAAPDAPDVNPEKP